MNTKEAIAHLKRIGYAVTEEKGKYLVKKVGRNTTFVYGLKSFYGPGTVSKNKPISARELIKFASVYSSNNSQNTALKKIVKKMDNSKNRSKERDLIKSNDIDKIDELGHTSKAKEEDPWNWD